MTSFYHQLPRFPDVPKKTTHKKRKSKSSTHDSFNEDFPYTAPPLDFSFRNFSTFQGALIDWESDVRESHDKPSSQNDVGKYCTTSLKLSNNLIEKWDGFDRFVTEVISNPTELYWLDLSFNFMYTIDEVILKFANMKILYLHGNAIDAMSEIDKLASLDKLIGLTLHGNPVDEESGYRSYVLKKLPKLRALDFTPVTSSDRKLAERLVDLMGYEKKFEKKRTKSVET